MPLKFPISIKDLSKILEVPESNIYYAVSKNNIDYKFVMSKGKAKKRIFVLDKEAVGKLIYILYCSNEKIDFDKLPIIQPIKYSQTYQIIPSKSNFINSKKLEKWLNKFPTT